MQEGATRIQSAHEGGQLVNVDIFEGNSRHGIDHYHLLACGHTKQREFVVIERADNKRASMLYLQRGQLAEGVKLSVSEVNSNQLLLNRHVFFGLPTHVGHSVAKGCLHGFRNLILHDQKSLVLITAGEHLCAVGSY